MIRSNGLRRLMRWGLGALAVLLAHGILAPSTVRAGCNHLVTSQADRQLDLHHLDGLITGAGDREAPRPPRPCSGPGCSNSTPRPMPVPSAGSDGPHDWIVAIPALEADAPALPRRIPDPTPARPVGHGPSIFHPPPA